MPRSYKLKFTPAAYEDLDQIYEYISGGLCAADSASRLMENIEKKIVRLQSFPYSCEPVSILALQEKGYRKLIVENYIVFYIVRENDKTVIIMRVIYGAQQYENLL